MIIITPVAFVQQEKKNHDILNISEDAVASDKPEKEKFERSLITHCIVIQPGAASKLFVNYGNTLPITRPTSLLTPFVETPIKDQSPQPESSKFNELQKKNSQREKGSYSKAFPRGSSIKEHSMSDLSGDIQNKKPVSVARSTNQDNFKFKNPLKLKEQRFIKKLPEEFSSPFTHTLKEIDPSKQKETQDQPTFRKELTHAPSVQEHQSVDQMKSSLTCRGFGTMKDLNETRKWMNNPELARQTSLIDSRCHFSTDQDYSMYINKMKNRFNRNKNESTDLIQNVKADSIKSKPGESKTNPNPPRIGRQNSKSLRGLPGEKDLKGSSKNINITLKELGPKVGLPLASIAETDNVKTGRILNFRNISESIKENPPAEPVQKRTMRPGFLVGSALVHLVPQRRVVNTVGMDSQANLRRMDTKQSQQKDSASILGHSFGTRSQQVRLEESKRSIAEKSATFNPSQHQERDSHALESMSPKTRQEGKKNLSNFTFFKKADRIHHQEKNLSEKNSDQHEINRLPSPDIEEPSLKLEMKQGELEFRAEGEKRVTRSPVRSMSSFAQLNAARVSPFINNIISRNTLTNVGENRLSHNKQQNFAKGHQVTIQSGLYEVPDKTTSNKNTKVPNVDGNPVEQTPRVQASALNNESFILKNPVSCTGGTQT